MKAGILFTNTPIMTTTLPLASTSSISIAPATNGGSQTFTTSDESFETFHIPQSVSCPATSHKGPSLAAALLEREGLREPNTSRAGYGKKAHSPRSPSSQWPHRVLTSSPGHGRSPSCTARLPSWSKPYHSVFASTLSTSGVHPLHKQQPMRSWRNSQGLWLSLYFAANLALTLYNKKVLNNFPYPYALTAVHCLSGTIGTMACAWLKTFKPPRLSREEKTAVVLFSFLYSINIVVSNISLGLVSIPVHQVIRALTPIFTLAVSVILLAKTPTKGKILCLIPVMVGVGFATYGDYSCTFYGFVLTIIGTVLAALKTVFTNVLQTPPKTAAAAPLPDSKSEKSPIPSSVSPALISIPISRKHTIRFARPTLSLDPMSLLYVLSPIAFAECMALSWMTGEWDEVVLSLMGRQGSGMRSSGGVMTALALNGIIAFALNVVSFNANKRVGAVGMSVAANVKQALTILLAVLIFDFVITPLNLLGISLTLIGGALYAWVELKEKERKKAVQEGLMLSTTR